MKPRLALLIGMIFGAAALRLLPHPPNFDPIGALALFGGAYVDRKQWAFVIPFAAMLLSDALIGFHSQMPMVYLAFGLIVCLGFTLRERRSVVSVTGMSVAASALFFVVSNLGVWAFEGMYPRNLEGLVACYVAAIPFLANTLAGTLFYTAVLFGAFGLAERKIELFAPAVRS